MNKRGPVLYTLDSLSSRLKTLISTFSQPDPPVKSQLATALLTKSIVEEIVVSTPAGDINSQSIWAGCKSGDSLTLVSDEATITASLSGQQVIWLSVIAATGMGWYIDFNTAAGEIEKNLVSIGANLKNCRPPRPAVRVRVSQYMTITSDTSFEIDGTYRASAQWDRAVQEALKASFEPHFGRAHKKSPSPITGMPAPEEDTAAPGKFIEEYGRKDGDFMTAFLDEESFSNEEVEKPSTCSNCGKKLSSGIKFCGKCGLPVHNDIEEESSPEKPASLSSPKGVAVCPGCGMLVSTELQSCTKCGHMFSR